jgi:cellulose biosynthesis protein BcsE
MDSLFLSFNTTMSPTNTTGTHGLSGEQNAPLPTTAISGGPARLSWLKRVLHRATDRSNPPACLPIGGLDPGVGDLPKDRMVFLTYDDIESRDILLENLHAAMALSETRATWLCTAHRVPHFLESGLQHRQRAIVWTDNAATEIDALGTQRFSSELQACGLQHDDVIIVDALDPWFAVASEDSALEITVCSALKQLSRLRQSHDGPILALAPSHRRGISLLPLLANATLDHLGSWHANGNCARLDVYRWGRSLALKAGDGGVRYDLQPAASGHWNAVSQVPLSRAAHLTPPDLDSVITLPSVMAGSSSIPDGWTVLPSLSDLRQACNRAIAATVVLPFERLDQLPELALLVNRLRLNHPNQLRIVIREIGGAMRRNGELVVRRLGANAVVARNQSFATLQAVVASIRDEVFPDKPAVDPAHLLRRLAPDPIKGYLPTVAFANAVSQMIERTNDTPLEHSLVQMPLLPNVRPSFVLSQCNLRRNGDVMTVDDKGIFLFLFACPADDAMEALGSLFTIPPSEMAQYVLVDPELRSQRSTLAELKQNAVNNASEDFSAPLQMLANGTGEATAQPVTLTTIADKPSRSLETKILALRENTELE